MLQGYCTNVHAGADLETTKDNLRNHAVGVKQRFSPDADMGIGLWLSAATAEQLLQSDGVDAFANWLQTEGLIPFTLNGFPYGDFHQEVVKHDVYQPTWWQPQRLEYTCNLIRILHRLLPDGMEGSISTLPIAWPDPQPSTSQLAQVAQQLSEVANTLKQLEDDTGRLISVCLEPEPGCFLQTSQDIVDFFQQHLLPGRDEDLVRRYLRVCHDVCHAAVMFEPQTEVLDRYRRAGLAVGKVQVSSAVRVSWDSDPTERNETLEQLREFAEDRYLHQTMCRARDGHLQFYEDLPQALLRDTSEDDEWNIHFHVPVYLESFGRLGTSHGDILDCLTAIAPDGVSHFEVETYAWGVLPPALQVPCLADGIAQEMAWLAQRL